MTATSVAQARIVRFLAEEPVVWLSSVRPDGTPHLVPIWFTWDGEALLVFSKPNAQKVRNLRANPSVMLALGEAEEDFDVGLIEAEAELLPDPATFLPAGHLEKYGARMAALGLSPAEFIATYSQVMRIRPTRFLSWHGRTVPMSVQVRASIDEPRHEATAAERGEPVSRLPRAARVELARRSLRDVVGGLLRPSGRAVPAI